MRSLMWRRGVVGASDPAPSRWAWRLERWMLTPSVRLILRAGVPLLVLFGGCAWWLSDETRVAAIRQAVTEARASFETRPEFMVQLMAIDGADAGLSQQIRAIVPLEFPVSSFDLDLAAMRDRIAELPPVRTVALRIRPGGVLQVDVTPRVPRVVWRNRKGLVLLDGEGAYVRDATRRSEHMDLPLVAGVGADRHIAEALSLYDAAAPLGARLRGLVRIGERRWDIVLDRGQRILLPEDAPVQALDRVIALDGAQDILARDVSRIDLRLEDRPMVQMSQYALEEWWRIRETSRQ